MASVFGKIKSRFQQPTEESYDGYYVEPQEEEMGMEEEVEEEMDMTADVAADGSDKVISFNGGMGDEPSVHFILFKPDAFEDTVIKAMVDELRKNNTVIINVEDTNKDVSRRIVDFLGGSAYALRGKVSRISEDTFIVMPHNVSLTGNDAMDEVNSENVYY